MVRALSIAIGLVLVSGVGCGKEAPKATRDQPAPPAAASGSGAATAKAPGISVPTHKHMQEHFDAIVGVRDALIAGNLEGARTRAQWIVEHETDPGVATWQEFVTDMRQWATHIVQATDLGPAAAAGAELARTCGRCHVVHNVAPELGTPDRPLPASGKIPHMQRHQWAAERMWEGLIGPSEARWTAGTAELVETPLGTDEIFANQSAGPRITDLAKQVHELGAEARATPTTAWDTRAAVYGRFLTTCAGCHQAIPPTTP